MRELQASPVTNATVSKGIRSIEKDILPKLRLESDQIKTLKVGNPLGDSLALLQQYSVARVDVLEALAHFWRVNNSSSEKSFEAKQTAESALRRRLEVDFNNLSMR